MLLALDAWLIAFVFQPIVDRLVRWRSHYGLAIFCITGAIMSLASQFIGTAWVVATRPQSFSLLALSSVGFANFAVGLTWYRRAKWYAYLEEAEEAGGFQLPKIGEAYVRVWGLATTLFIFVPMDTLFVIANGSWEMVFQATAFLLAVASAYFAACGPGTPRRKVVWVQRAA